LISLAARVLMHLVTDTSMWNSHWVFIQCNMMFMPCYKSLSQSLWHLWSNITKACKRSLLQSPGCYSGMGTRRWSWRLRRDRDVGLISLDKTETRCCYFPRRDQDAKLHVVMIAVAQWRRWLPIDLLMWLSTISM